MQVSVFGLGYVGVVSLVCLAEQGHDVWGVDIDSHKLELLERGESPVDEPGVCERLNDNSISKRIHLTDQATPAVKNTELGFICVGTPPTECEGLDVSSVLDVIRSILGVSPSHRDDYTIVVRSTLNPGTVEKELLPILKEHENFSGKLLFNPEFLREGTAIEDFYNPPFTVIGTEKYAGIQDVEFAFQHVNAPLIEMGYKEAEMLKFVCNAFHALKVSFANEIGAIASSIDANADKVMSTFVRDKKLNISSNYLKPGFAFGGSCLPKDVQSIVNIANQNCVDVSLLESILSSNENHIKRAAEKISKIGADSIAISGLPFKSGTDDLRNSPAIKLAKRLIESDNVKVYICPVEVEINEIYGKNLSYLRSLIPDYSSRLIELEEIDRVDICVTTRQIKEVDEYVRSLETRTLNVSNV